MLTMAACATTPTAPEPAREPARPTAMLAQGTEHRPAVSVPVAVGVDDPVTRGELPWWYALKEGIYRFEDETVVLAVGESSSHKHVAEGFLNARVTARLAVRRAAERIRFKGSIPEPSMLDLFVTRERRFLALYIIRVPRDAGVPGAAPSASPPGMLKMNGRRRVGRHIFEGDRHLFLECDVEGPIANPDWGRTRASA
jgi:hypothetical protein